MVKHLNLDDAPPQVKEFVKQLDLDEAEYVLELGGKPVVGVVAHWQVEKLSQRRAAALSLLQRSWERNRAIPQEVVDRTVAEVVQQVRQENGPGKL